MQVVYKNSDYRRILWSITTGSILCHQHLDGMRPFVSTVDALYTNAALPRISRYLVYNT